MDTVTEAQFTEAQLTEPAGPLTAPVLRARTRRDLPWAAGAILAAPFAWVLSGGLAIQQQGWIDAGLYTGYANNYGALLQRYGLLYYATRITAIFPERVFVSLLGGVPGYYAWHYILAIAALGSVYGIARRHYGVATAVVATALLAVVPWLPGALASDYVDGAAIAYLLVGMFLVLGLEQRPALRWFGAGCAFSLAITSHLFASMIALSFVGAWLLFGFNWGVITTRLRCAAWVAGGVVAVQVGLGALMAWRYPTAGFWFMGKNFETSGELLSGGAAQWFVSFDQALRANIYLWVPMLAGGAAVILAAATPMLRPSPDRRRLLFVAATFFAGCWLVFVDMHWRGLGSLSGFFYLTYFIPAFALTAIVVIGEVMVRLPPRRSRNAAVIAVVVLGIAFALFRSGAWLWDPDRSMLAVGFLLLFALLGLRRWPAVVACVVLLALFALPFAFGGSGGAGGRYLAIAQGTNAQQERDAYRHSIDFQDGVLASVPPEKSVGFWYDDADRWLWSVQATFLWGYSRLALGSMAMPRLHQQVRTAADRYDYLVLLAPTAGPVRAGASALCRAGVGLQPVARKVLRGEALDLHYAVFERTGSTPCPDDLYLGHRALE